MSHSTSARSPQTRPVGQRPSGTALLTLTCLVASAVSDFGSSAVRAQERENTMVVEEVLVTARRRSESLQDVPIAVSSLNSEQIRQRGIQTEADLQASVPGLMVRVTNSSNQLNYALRGQTVDSFSNSQPAVLAYVNEVQAGGITTSSFFDLESVQVVKGPQGTLFGRNATGGAVLYQTKTPTSEFGGYLRGGLGNYSNQQLEGAINVPLSDTWAVRVAGLLRERDGWQKNLYNGDDLASIDTENVRLSIGYTGDKLQNQFAAYYGDHGGKTEGLRVRNAYTCLVAGGGVCLQGEPNPNNPSVDVGDLLFATELYPEGSVAALGARNPQIVELGAQYGFAGYASYIEATESLGLDKVFNDQSNDSDIQHTLITNSTTFELSSGLTLKNIIGYNNVESFQSTDVDGSPFFLLRMGDETTLNAGYVYDTQQFSEELQLSGQALDDRLDFIFGVYYFNETFTNRIPLKFIADYQGDLFGPAFAYHADIDDESTSVFAQGTYSLSDNLNLTAGYRHTWEEVSIQHLPDDAYFQGAGLTGEFSQKVDRPSWLLSLDYRISDETMIYLAHRGSWRTGGYNVTSINVTPDGVVPDSFKPEKTWDIEAGLKFAGMLGSVPSRINLAIYHQTVEDAQKTVYLQITSQTGNVGEAKVSGAEIDATFNFTDWLEAGFGYAYTDARYTDPQGDVVGYTFEFGPYADAPKNMYSAYVATRNMIADVGELTFRADYYHTDEAFFSNLDDTIGPGTDLPEYDLLHFRVGLENIFGSRVSTYGYIRNATDEEYERGGLPLAGVTATNTTITGEPRTYGLEFLYRFD